MKRFILITATAILGLVLLVPGASLYYESGGGRGCTSCHEMQTMYDDWHSSSHRGIACQKCHGGALTLDPAFHWNNAMRLVAHVRGDLPERIGFANRDVQAMTDRCRSCHRQEYAAWHAGPHSASYARIFLDKQHNTANKLMDDCLRCHGMHFGRGIAELVTPISHTGPWRLQREDLSNLPSMPCLTCHEIHRTGPVLTKVGVKGSVPGPMQEVMPSSLAFFDRRTQQSIPAADLPLPAMLEGTRAVKMSPDQRQALCYQCHAPVYTRQVASGDDRTAIGVHEGISCLACHSQHGQTTRASCATCHPKMSNCGLDVEKMDTTFRSAGSRHNIHWVKCTDCHGAAVPKRKASVD
jgi:nitrate/TMAO reductase-like tetraheme cytochrome c subunit